MQDEGKGNRVVGDDRRQREMVMCVLLLLVIMMKGPRKAVLWKKEEYGD